MSGKRKPSLATTVGVSPLMQALLAVRPAMGTDETRPHLAQTLLSFSDDGKCTATATNGHILMRHVVDVVVPPSKAFDAVVTGYDASRLARSIEGLPKDGGVDVLPSNGITTFRFFGGSVVCQAGEIPPPFHRVIDDAEKLRGSTTAPKMFGVDLRYMQAMAKGLRGSEWPSRARSAPHTRVYAGSGPMDPLVLRPAYGEHPMMVLMPVRVDCDAAVVVSCKAKRKAS